MKISLLSSVCGPAIIFRQFDYAADLAVCQILLYIVMLLDFHVIMTWFNLAFIVLFSVKDANSTLLEFGFTGFS